MALEWPAAFESLRQPRAGSRKRLAGCMLAAVSLASL
jgi:hypothetical protein